MPGEYILVLGVRPSRDDVRERLNDSQNERADHEPVELGETERDEQHIDGDAEEGELGDAHVAHGHVGERDGKLHEPAGIFQLLPLVGGYQDVVEPYNPLGHGHRLPENNHVDRDAGRYYGRNVEAIADYESVGEGHRPLLSLRYNQHMFIVLSEDDRFNGHCRESVDQETSW